jgi:cytochrome P450
MTPSPPLLHLDLTSQAFKKNPFPTLARLRDAGPLVRMRLPIVGRVLLATTYDTASDLLRDHQQFVVNPFTAGNRFLGTLLRWAPRSLRPLATHMLLRDEPDHRRLRSLVEQAFQRQSVEALRPRLEILADQALDHLAEQAARSGAPGGVDLLAHFARPFPLAVICELLGLPPEDRPQFSRWSSRLTTAHNLPGIVWGLLGLRPLMQYVRDEIRRQSRHPRDGLLAALIEAEEAGDRLSEDELVAMVFLLLVAGHETTLHQITHSVLTLLDHPDQLRELTADWSLAESAVQELLRYISFAQITKPRYPRADTEFCGYPVRRGQMLFACLASANSDPAHFENPDQLNLRRHPNRHLAFGAGIHYCLGAKLSSVETQIALQKLFTRFPNLQLSIPLPAPEQTHQSHSSHQSYRDRVTISQTAPAATGVSPAPIAYPNLRYTPRFGTRALLALPVKW